MLAQILRGLRMTLEDVMSLPSWHAGLGLVSRTLILAIGKTTKHATSIREHRPILSA
ncbi:MAG: hypothetical protein AAF564_22405 [Bacteroidota bacterium]